MNKSLEQATGRYAEAKPEQAVYEKDGKKYVVIRHFTGDRDINQIIAELAVLQANREMGLS